MIKKIKINFLLKYKFINLVGPNIKIGIYKLKKIIIIVKILKLNFVQLLNNKKFNLFKIINYSKYLFLNKKKKNNKKKKIKNIKINPNISNYDLKYRINKIKKLLNKNFKIRINMFFRGRTILFINKGKYIFNYIIKKIKKNFFFIKKPFIKKKNMIMIISNKKK
ncbi:MAG: translation initiation factor IF-3 [Candidatus Shikimatogenerans sp. Tduv]|uniref:Translation initiation factor IF-3 n=1 Tax=Candidatus Shikimatogenerans sp. Tduv TaxID=3158567 RepID=A0AAU7QRI6_9FLAO